MKKAVCLLIITIMLSAAFAASLPISGIEPTVIDRYGKSTITDENVRYVYDLLETELTKEEPPEKINIPQDKIVSKDALDRAYRLFISDYSECFWVQNEYRYSVIGEDVREIMPTYRFTGDELQTAKAELDGAVKRMLAGMPQTSNYDKALYLHDRLAEAVTYEFAGEHQTAYGALVAGKAVCAGYAAAYQLLLQQAGIQAWTVTGTSPRPGEETPIGHAWNLVWIEEGICVYTDVTWDDGGTETFHRYFNISKQAMETDHTVSAEIFQLPHCGHEQHSYFSRTGYTVDDRTTAAELAALFGPAKDGKRKASFYYEGENIEAFLNRVQNDWIEDLYVALSGEPGQYRYGFSVMSGEIKMTITGVFPESPQPESSSKETEMMTEAETAPVESGTESLVSTTEEQTESETETAEHTTESAEDSENTEESVETETQTEEENSINQESESSAITDIETKTDVETDNAIDQPDYAGEETDGSSDRRAGCRSALSGDMIAFCLLLLCCRTVIKRKKVR